MKIKFIHIRNAANINKGGQTVALECDRHDMVHAYAVAYCHPKDNFCKRTGRIKAEGKLKSKHSRIIVDTPEDFKLMLEFFYR